MKLFDKMHSLAGRRICSLLLTLVFLISPLFYACSSEDSPSDLAESSPQSNLSFNEYCDKLFVDFATSDALTLNYLISDISNYDIESYPEVMVDFDSDDISVDEEELSSIEENLAKYDYNELNYNQQVTYDTLRYYIESSKMAKGLEMYMEPLGPTIGTQAELPITLGEFSFYEKDDIDHYLTALPTVYDLFEEIMKFEEKKSKEGLFMSDKAAKAVIEQCSDFIKKPEKNVLICSFNDKIDARTDLTDDEKSSYKDSNKKIVLEKIIPAYQLIIDKLNSLMTTGFNTGGLCNLKDGSKYYEYLVRQNVGTDEDVTTIASRLDDFIEDNLSELTSLSASDKELLTKMQNADTNYSDPSSMLQTLSEQMKSDFPDIGTIDYKVKKVDSSLEDYLSPAMYYKPPVDTASVNNIYINNSKMSNNLDTFITLSHEGFPGHMYEFNYIKKNENHALIQALDIKGVSEGWAKFAEYTSYKYAGLDENTSTALSLNSKIALCIEARADIGVNYESWTDNDVYDYVSQYFKISEDVGDTIYESVIETPSNTLSYAYGELKYELLEDSAKENLGNNYKMIDFTTFVLDTGIAPFPIIEHQFETLYLNKE